jgi:hypothetical protein
LTRRCLSLGELLEKAEALLASPVRTEQEIEMSVASPVLAQLVDSATGGTITYLTREGRRLAAVVPADLAESLAPEPPAGFGTPTSARRLSRVVGVSAGVERDHAS